MKRALLVVVAVVLSLLGVAGTAAGDEEHVVVGSKAFPESWILGEAVATVAREAGARTEHHRGMGATQITYEALASGAIDVYPEYTGTVHEVILHGAGGANLDGLRVSLEGRGIGVSDPLGFDDSYGLATSRASAERTGLRTLSDLKKWPALRVGLTHEFLGRADGYPGLAARYGLALTDVRGLQHELALEALARGELDVVDVYTTDAQIDRLGLRVLEDDQGFFPRYEAVLLYRKDLAGRAPRALAAVLGLGGRVGATAMRRANARLVIDGASVDDAARGLLVDALGAEAKAPPPPSTALEIAHDTVQHLELVVIALLASIGVGLPLGIAAARSRSLGFVVTAVSGMLQTIPSLALLALLVPLLGIGARPAIAALVLYGLLPIVRNTQVGLTTIPASIAESAEAIGLPPRARLLHVFLPMASPHILAGVRTSAVIAVGSATLAALVGAEGLGGPILQGIALRDTSLVLRGAVPAALLALLVDAAFAGVTRLLVPQGLRGARGTGG